MKIALYEPSGSGGIFHYTFELAEGLVTTSAHVFVLTKRGHELPELTRGFEIKAQLQESQIKQFFTDIKARIWTTCHGCLQSGGYNTVGNGSLVVRHGGNLRRIELWSELLYTLMMRRVDVVHFQWLDEPIYDYYFMQLLKLFGFKVVYTAHNIVPHEVISGEDLLFGKIYNLVDRVIVHATNNKKEMIDHFGVPDEKICVVPHGAYTLFFRHLSITKEAARDQLGLPRDKPIILFFGAIRQYKGLELLVEAFKLVREREATSTLLVVGDVPPVDPESVARYSRLMAELSTVDQVVCRKGYVDFHSVSRYFLACDVVVLPYVKTYQSGVLMVACAAGRPAIVTNTGGLAEVLDQGQSGIVVPPGKVEDLAEAILSLVSDPKRAEVMGRHALRLSQSVYSWESVARQTLGVYESLISKRGGQPVAADCEYH